MDPVRNLRNNFRNSIEWGTRLKGSGFFKNLRRRLRSFLDKLSGGDMIVMLHDILTKQELSSVYSKHVRALTKLGRVVSNKQIVKPRDKHYFIRAIRESGIGLTECKELGFVCSKNLWIGSRNVQPRSLGGRPNMPSEWVKQIKEHMEKNSNVASNRSVIKRHYNVRNPFFYYKKKKIGEELESVRYRETTLNEAFRTFKESAHQLANRREREQRLNTKFSTFCKYLEPSFKKPYRYTDLCEICEFGKDLEKDIKRSLLEYDFTDEFSPDSLLEMIIEYLQNNPNSRAKLKLEQCLKEINELKLKVENFNFNQFFSGKYLVLALVYIIWSQVIK